MGIKALDELFDYIRKHKRPPRKQSMTKELIDLIYNKTKFILPQDASLRERIYCLFHNTERRPLCPICKKNELKFNDEKFRYAFGCSQKCIQKNKLVRQKVEETNLHRYGVKHSMQSDLVKQKAKESCLIRYAVNHPMKLDNVKQKVKETNLKRYGVDSYSKTDHFKSFMKSLMLSDKGQEILCKTKQTNKVRYAVEFPLQHKNILDKAHKAFKHKYKTSNPMQLEDIKAKFKQTMKTRYNVYWNGQRLDFRQKLSKLFKKKADYFRFKQFERWWKYSKPIIEDKCNVEFLFNFDEFVKKGGATQHSYFRFRCKQCGHVFETYLSNGHLPLCPKCNKRYFTHIEEACINFVKSLSPSLATQTKVRFLDIDDYVPLAESVKALLLE